MESTPKDVFIIHSRGDPAERNLAARLIDWLGQLGISVYEYADWQWARSQPGKVRYSSAGSDLDLLRYAMGHPEPFRRQSWEDVPDEDALLDLLDRTCVVALIAPRAGAPSPGVRLELELLPQQPSVVLAGWGEHDRFFLDWNRHTYRYEIRDLLDSAQEASALDLAHLLWVHWIIDRLVREGKSIGRKLLAEVACRDADVHRIVRFSKRFTTVEAIAAELTQEYEPETLDAALVDLAASHSAEELRPIAHDWWGRGAMQSFIPLPHNTKIAALVEHVSRAVNAFCEAALSQYPELSAEKALGLRLRAVLAFAASSLADSLPYYEQALQLPGLPDAARSEVLADRASKTVRSSPDAALADIDAVLALPGASDAATAQSLWVRARLHARRGHGAGAISDFSAALALGRIPPFLRALCLHDRATAHIGGGDPKRALDDLNEAITIPDLPSLIAGPAHLDRAVLRGEMGDRGGEISDYSQVIAMPDIPDTTRLKAYMYRGYTRLEDGDRNGAIEDFLAVRDDPASPSAAKRAAIEQLDRLDPLRSP